MASRFATFAAVVFAVSCVVVPSAHAAADLKADYRFEDNFRNSQGAAGHLKFAGPVRLCPPCSKFKTVKINGKREGVWEWLSDDGLKLDKAGKALGKNGKTYSFAFRILLNEVNSYRKLVDFNDLTSDEGWYVYDEALYPYDLTDFEYDKQLVQAGKWREIVLTRDGTGKVRGYVDGEETGKADDPEKTQVLGPQNVLRFLRDDFTTNGEETGGMIDRLRIWDDALSKRKIKKLSG